MNTETEDYEDIADEDEEVQKQPKKMAKPMVAQKRTQERVEAPVEKVRESRYVAFRVNAQEGVMDTETDTPVGTEVYVILAEILNKLNDIEISQA
jgi:hypothetical protein